MKTARVIEEHKTNYVISDGNAELLATVRGAFFNEGNFPKVGDWVSFTELVDDKAVIEEVLPRTSTIARKDGESGDLQVIVTNVDYIFIVMGLDNDFNLSRLERYLLLAKKSEVEPVVILNKLDMVEDSVNYVSEVESVAGDVPVHAVSALANQNMDVLLRYLTPGTTAVLLGSSGAGKSTITNWLLNQSSQKVSGIREDDSRGRHTTTARQLFKLPSGASLIDTPGMRELGVLDSTTDDEKEIFAQIDELSEHCRFSNCDHEKSIGCAVLNAISAGELTERQLASYHKLQRERLFEESKHDDGLSRQQKQKQKRLFKSFDEAHQKKRFDSEF